MNSDLIIKDEPGMGYITDIWKSLITHEYQLHVIARPKPGSGLSIVLSQLEISRIRDILTEASEEIGKIIYLAVGRYDE